jgi:cyclopropane fatty-acyl-phospholipid synthase-like methyltransferase
MEWYPTPSYLLKRQAILEGLAALPGRRVLEIGCGAGDLLVRLGTLGYRGIGIDISAEARTAARARVGSGPVQVDDRDFAAITELFDVIIASEVMEHIDDDGNFLRMIRDRLEPGGSLLLTVPAHMARWGANDDFSGHVRRYERDELATKVHSAGFSVVRLSSYGVPLYNLMKPLYDRAIKQKLDATADIEQRTKLSSGMWLCTDRQKLFNLLFNDLTMWPFYCLQRLFYATDLGNGYILIAKKN